MTTATYNRLGNNLLKPFYSVKIVKQQSTDGSINKHVEFHSTIHKNMPVKLTFCFSDSFSDSAILNDRDVITKFINHFGASALV